ncbi:MAG: GNAT family N-acetyltransferase [Isosphaeraceae bacterium]
MLDETEQHIGFIALTAINWRNRVGTGGLVLGERSAWGQGYGTAAVQTRTRFAFGQLGPHRINAPLRQHPVNAGSARRAGEQPRGNRLLQGTEPAARGNQGKRNAVMSDIKLRPSCPRHARRVCVPLR